MSVRVAVTRSHHATARRKEPVMTAVATKIADEYLRAWLAKDVEKALSYVADDVVCDAPTGRITGLAGYRKFLEPFVHILVGGEVTDVLGDDTHAATVYLVDTPFAKDFRGMEYVTVDGGRITHIVSVFDRTPMMQATG